MDAGVDADTMLASLVLTLSNDIEGLFKIEMGLA
jgi:hypothetical protein